MSKDKKDVTLLLEIIAITKKAYLVSDDGGKTDAWIPKSQIEVEKLCEKGDTVYFKLPEWLATAKGFV